MSYVCFAKAAAVGSLPSTDALKGGSQPQVLWRKVDMNITASTWRPVSVSAGLARVNSGWLQSNSGSQLGTHFRITWFKNTNLFGDSDSGVWRGLRPWHFKELFSF